MDIRGMVRDCLGVLEEKGGGWGQRTTSFSTMGLTPMYWEPSNESILCSLCIWEERSVRKEG